jgi:integrase
MITTNNTKLSPHQKRVEKFKKWIASEIKKSNRVKKNRSITSTPKFYFSVDKKSNKIVLNYYVPVFDASVKRNNGIKQKKVQKYLGNWSLDTYEKDGFSVLSWYEYVCDEVNRHQTECFVDESSLEYWIKLYVSPTPRRGVKSIPTERTRTNEKFFLYDYHNWLKDNHPKYLNLWYHNDDAVREIVMEYFRFRTSQSIHSEKGWGESTIFNVYRIIRSFLNWISIKEVNFKSNRLSNLPVEKPKPTLDTFTQIEFQKVIKFMKDNSEDTTWSWFIPILRLMLVSGCRISEAVNMRINELSFFEENGKDIIEWKFRGKGNKERTFYIDSSTTQSDIIDAIKDENGEIRTDKEWVFHKRFWKGGNKYGAGIGMIDNVDEPFTISGVGHKFKKMVKLLKLNPKLTPHSTRRYFITEKLLSSGGNIPLVALLVGHSSFEMVNHYQKHNQQSEMLKGIRNTLNFGEVIKRKKGIKYDKSK